MRRYIIFGLLFLLAGSSGFVGYRFYQWSEFLDELVECGFTNGPCYGERVTLDGDSMRADIYIDVPNGKIGFLHTTDTLPPLIFKVDKNAAMQWALRLESESCSGTPLREMRGMKLLVTEGGLTIDFFNETYSEPGAIYLNEQYDFEYMCLSSM